MSKHIKFISTLPCSYQSPLCYGDIVAAHIRKGSGAGMGQKPSDDKIIPLCFGHHAEQHQIGELSFHKSNLEAAKKLAFDLYENSGDKNYCIKIMFNFWRQ